MNNNYPGSSQAIRNIADIRTSYEVVHTEGHFRIVRLASPYFDGAEYWVINERGFLWEPANSEEAARAYLRTEEALEYQPRS